MASLKDVARKANVSLMTVSRVVNNYPFVNSETRNRILAIIQELNYSPNAIARALNGQRTRNIGVMLPQKEYFLTAPFYTELLARLEEHLQPKGYHLFFGSMNPEHGSGGYSLLFRRKLIDGLVVFAPKTNDAGLLQLVEEKYPFIVVHGRSLDIEYPSVDVDNKQGTSTILRHLLDLGHRRIGFVTGRLDEINAVDRFGTYKAALEQEGIAFVGSLVAPGDWTLESGYRSFAQLYESQEPPTAILCSNDQMAIGLLKAAHDRGVTVPDEVSIAGFDDIRFASFVSPALTTVRQPLELIAQAAADLILEQTEKKEGANRRILLAPQLIVRSSTGSPRT